MTDLDVIQMMKRCSAEIKGLRARIDYLEPRADAYENLKTVLGLLPKPSQGYGEDLAWKLDCQVAELELKRKAEAQNESGGVPPATNG